MSQLSCVPCHIWSSIGATLPWTPKAHRTFKSQHHPSNDDHDDKYDDYDDNSLMMTLMTRGSGAPPNPTLIVVPPCALTLSRPTPPFCTRIIPSIMTMMMMSLTMSVMMMMVWVIIMFLSHLQVCWSLCWQQCAPLGVPLFSFEKSWGVRCFFLQKLLIQATFHIEATKPFFLRPCILLFNMRCGATVANVRYFTLVKEWPVKSALDANLHLKIPLHDAIMVSPGYLTVFLWRWRFWWGDSKVTSSRLGNARSAIASDIPPLSTCSCTTSV